MVSRVNAEGLEVRDLGALNPEQAKQLKRRASTPQPQPRHVSGILSLRDQDADMMIA